MITNARATYLNATVATATPQRLLVMLYDRLLLDLRRGIQAQREERCSEASMHLLHAQEIVNELRASLNAEVWAGGPVLASIYDWLFGELVAANIGRDVAASEACLAVVEPLAHAWREAAMGLGVDPLSS